MPIPHLYIHTPVPLFKARVNMPGTVTYPLSDITFDGVTLGAYTDTHQDLTVLLGTTDGADDLGRVRIKGVPTSTTLPIPRTSRGNQDGLLDIVDNAYITVLWDYRPWAKIPYYDIDNGADFKDGDELVGAHMTDIEPVANTGPYMVGYIDPNTNLLEVEFPGNGFDLSYAMADGATIVSYSWQLADGTPSSGLVTDPVMSATFPAGSRWVYLTVTDSNGKDNTGRCFVLAIDPDDDPTWRDYSITQNLQKDGQVLDIQIYDTLDRSLFPDGTLVLFWWDEPSGPSDRSHIKFVGWLNSEHYNVSFAKTGLVKGTSLSAIDIAGWLRQLPGFAQALYRTEELDEDDNPISPWSYMPSLSMDKALFYILHWHSTALIVADFIMPDLSDYDALRLDSGASNLFDQVNSLAMKLVPDHYLTCNTKGQLQVKRDWRLDDLSDRPDPNVVMSEDDWNNLEVEYNRHPKYHVLRSGAILAATAFTDEDDDGDADDIPLVFSIAPGDAASFGQGMGEQVENEGLALSQDDLNRCEGHRWAMINSRFGDFTFIDPSRQLIWSMEPAEFNRIEMTIPAAYAAYRGLPFTAFDGLIQTIAVRYQTSRTGVAISATVTINKEESGYPAVTYIPEDTEDVGYTPPDSLVTVPPGDLFTGQSKVAGVSQYHFYVTEDFGTPSGSGGPTWARKDFATSTAEKILSWCVDPFSPGYLNQDGTGEVNGYVVTHDKIYRVEDIFGSCTRSDLHTFATDAAGASHWRSIQCSFGAFFPELADNPWIMVISYYGSTGGHTGTYCTHSEDGGFSFSTDKVVSTFYDTALAIPQPIGVYASPKTPGLGYTMAYIETDGLAIAHGFQTNDYGETWTEMAATEDPIELLPLFGSFDEETINTYTEIGPNSSATISQSYSSNGPADIKYESVIIAPPADTKRLVVRIDWTAENTSTGGSGSQGCALTFTKKSTVTRTGTSDFVDPGVNAGPSSGSFEHEYTFATYASQDWPKNREELEATPPTSGTDCIDYKIATGADANFGNTRVSTMSITVTVTEIELDDATTYTPVVPGLLLPIHGQGGAIHVPWPDNADESVIYYGSLDRTGNRLFDLVRVLAGTPANISPSASSKDYGVNHGHFSIRTYDSDRSHVLLGGIGNQSSSSASNDQSGLWISHDEGDTWTQLIAPAAISGFLRGIQAAFGATSEDEIYAWGGYTAGSTCMLYSSDGSSFDNREGNLASLVEGTYGDIAFQGIAGGPIE